MCQAVSQASTMPLAASAADDVSSYLFIFDVWLCMCCVELFDVLLLRLCFVYGCSLVFGIVVVVCLVFLFSFTG